MKIVRYIPLLTYVLILYNILAFIPIGEGQAAVNFVIMNFSLFSGAAFIFTAADFLVILGIILLYIEILKATQTSMSSVIDHALSMLVFVVFLIEFLLVSHTGTADFLTLTFMSLLDVVAGFTVTISSARRDIAVDR